MKIGTKILILFLTLNLLSCKGSAQETEAEILSPELGFSAMEKDTFPKAFGIINDYGEIFTESQRTELNKTLYEYYIKTSRQIVIVTIDSIGPYQNAQKYAVALGNNWKIGTADKNNGLTIVLCSPCRQIGIATGNGTEQVLTDEICKEVIEKTIIPEFKNGNIYEGVKSGVTELIEKWE